MAEDKNRPTSPFPDVDEGRMFDEKLEGKYALHDYAHSPASSPAPAERKAMRERPTSAKHTGRWSSARLQPSVTISDNSSEVFCVRFSPDGRYLAAGCADGAIRVFTVATGRLAYNLQAGSATSLPCTSLRFRPATTQNKTRNVLVAVTASGLVQHWHMTSNKCLSTIQKPEAQYYALDYRPDGAAFAVSGKDHVVRVFDESTKQETACMEGGTGYGASSTPGHSNRVFAIKFNPQEPDMILTGGWDNTVQFWDVRAGHSVRSIFGPHISGDALDVCGDEILTGSWRPEKPLELWDYRSGRLIDAVPWSRSASAAAQPTLLYAAQFSAGSGGRYIAAGGSGANEAKVFDHHNQNALVGTITGLSRGVFTLDFSPDQEQKKLAVAGGDASIRIIDIVEDAEQA